MHEENGRCVDSDLHAGSKFILVLCFEVARINRDCEVRPATDFVHVIDRFVRAFFKTRGCGNGEMTSSRKSYDADSIGIDSPFLRAASNQTNGALRVLERTTRGLA